MKLRFTLFLFVALIVTSGAHANNSFRFIWDDELILKGEFADIGTRSVKPVLPIAAGISNNALCIEFSSAIGDVTITITGPNGVVYSTTMDVTTVAQQTSFSLEGLAPGSYLLEFKNSPGGYIYGEFIVD